jgi:hypothetical protein
MMTRHRVRRLFVVLIGVLALPAGIAQAATTVKARHDNDSVATAQLVSLQADLVLRQRSRTSSSDTAQPVSPTHMAVDVFGTIAQHRPAAVFSFDLQPGDQPQFAVSAKDPAKGFPELLLRDPNGNLVAIASGNGANGSDSVIDFTIPDGAGGSWTVEVTQSPSAPVAKNVFPYDLRITGSPMTYRTDVLGRIGSSNKPAFDRVATRDGDHLHFHVSAKDPAKGFPELLLRDPNGNLVAVAVGNGSNGSDCVIDFTVPGGGAGSWTVAVAQSPNVPPTRNHFAYDLEITGATGAGPVIPR